MTARLPQQADCPAAPVPAAPTSPALSAAPAPVDVAGPHHKVLGLRRQVLRLRRRAVPAALLASALTGCSTGSPDSSSRVGGALPQLAVAPVAGLGEVLVDRDGRVLYQFEPDEATAVTCTGSCARNWPPLVKDGDASGPGVRAELLGEAPSAEGGEPVVTYAGWPLYRYAADGPQQAAGHELNLNGGRWYAMTATGQRAG